MALATQPVDAVQTVLGYALCKSTIVVDTQSTSMLIHSGVGPARTHCCVKNLKHLSAV